MRTDTKDKIIKIIEKKELTVKEIVSELKLSPQIIHRHLKDLQEKKVVGKIGSAPKVKYFFKKQDFESQVFKSKNFFENNLLDDYRKKIKIGGYSLPSGELNLDFLIKQNALFSSKIEGNTLDINSFLNSQEFYNKTKPKEVEEILNLSGSYNFAEKNKLNEKNLLKAHALLSKTLVPKSRQGVYRKEPVGIFSKEGLVYLAVEHNLLGQEMNNFFDVIQKLLKNKLGRKESFFWASWIHLQFVLIHPFSDGNGRMARLLEKWFLTQKLGKDYWYIKTEEYYFENIKNYYKNLNLGPNYWEVDFSKGKKFLEMLPKTI